MKFFLPDVWSGKEIIFPNQPEVIWVLDQKLSEKSSQRTQERCVAPNSPSVAWAVFSCNQKDGLGAKHAVKIYMQAPWTDTELMTANARRAQADSNRSLNMAREIKALRRLTEHGSKHTPHLVAELHTTQGDDGIVPTGCISYILMTWCPGVPLSGDDYFDKTKAEKIRIFEAFEAAFEDTKRCGVLSKEPNPGDLIWDAANDKCYMVDFKFSGRPSSFNIVEHDWRLWGLFPGPPSALKDD